MRKSDYEALHRPNYCANCGDTNHRIAQCATVNVATANGRNLAFREKRSARLNGR